MTIPIKWHEKVVWHTPVNTNGAVISGIAIDRLGLSTWRARGSAAAICWRLRPEYHLFHFDIVWEEVEVLNHSEAAKKAKAMMVIRLNEVLTSNKP